MADKVMSSYPRSNTESQLKMKVKPQCEAFIPGLDRIPDYAGIFIALMMVAVIFSVAFGLQFLFGR